MTQRDAVVVISMAAAILLVGWALLVGAFAIGTVTR